MQELTYVNSARYQSIKKVIRARSSQLKGGRQIQKWVGSCVLA
jgi:hypothetical protein